MSKYKSWPCRDLKGSQHRPRAGFLIWRVAVARQEISSRGFRKALIRNIHQPRTDLCPLPNLPAAFPALRLLPTSRLSGSDIFYFERVLGACAIYNNVFLRPCTSMQAWKLYKLYSMRLRDSSISFIQFVASNQ